MKVSLILACAGTGVRAGFNKNKLLVEKGGKTVLEQTLCAFYDSGLIDQIVIATSKTDFEFVQNLVLDKATVVLGGKTRTDSVKNALEKVDGDIVLIHDGARPFVSTSLIKNCIETAKEFGSAIPVVSTRDTIVKVNDNLVDAYLGKDELKAVQTPQGFLAREIKKAYQFAGDKTFNDDGQVYLNCFGKLNTYAGEEQNVKLTFKEDFNYIKPQYRFGTGFDSHKLVENRKLILGGVVVPHDKGLLGHSDADVLTHAIMDAILSSLSLRDIGYHFSDKDLKWKDANSIELLKIVLGMVKEQGYKVQSISATIMAEKPKLLGFIPEITNSLANALNLSPEFVGIGATTLEGLGFVGREEGICTHATATLVRI